MEFADRTQPEAHSRLKAPTVGALAILFKFRIVVLLLWSAVGGAFLAAQGFPGWGILGLVLLTGGLAASGASAWNQYLEKGTDSLMRRTKKRPLVTGELQAGWVPYVATAMIVVPSLLVAPFKPWLTFFLLLGAFIYVVIYTIILKPRTLLNIVIGGAAGSAAVLSGSAAVGYWNDPGAIVLALLIFLWTPTHFWSLAIVYHEDYARSKTPMLPSKTSPHRSAMWVMLHTVSASFAAVALTLHPALGWLYFVPVLLVTIYVIWLNIKLMLNPAPKQAMKLFKVSNMYLGVVLLMIIVDSLIPFI